MNQCNEDVMKTHPPNSFHHIFWEQHHNSIKQKDARQIRWHPAMIKWCLSLKLLSSSCYNALRSSGVIKLPSDRTLRDYTNWTKLTTGLSTSVDQQLLIEANLESSEHNCYVCLIFDECKIKEDLVYDKHTGELIGFVDITDINNHLKSIEKSYDKSTAATSVQKLATHMLMFMVRGLFSSLKFPYAQFSTNNLTGDLIFPIFWKVVERLELLGLVVVCDGAAPNRKFFKLYGDKSTYKINNPYADSERHIYFISDVSHLIKTVRNCFLNLFLDKWPRHQVANVSGLV